MSSYPCFPMFVDLSEKHIVVVGAGTIAARRVWTLIDFTPHITVIAPDVHPDIDYLENAGKVTVLRKGYEDGDLRDADIVLAATDDSTLNAQINIRCKERGVPVNVSSDRKLCNFYFPGIIRQDNVVIGVTASGTDHREVRTVTEQIKQCLANRETSRKV